MKKNAIWSEPEPTKPASRDYYKATPEERERWLRVCAKHGMVPEFHLMAKSGRVGWTLERDRCKSMPVKDLIDYSEDEKMHLLGVWI